MWRAVDWVRPSFTLPQENLLRAYSNQGFCPAMGISSARSLTVSRESFEVIVSGGSTFASVKLKEIDGMAPQGVERAV